MRGSIQFSRVLIPFLVGILAIVPCTLEAQTPPQDAVGPQQEAEVTPQPAAAKLEGPMRIESYGILETRVSFGGQAPPPRAPAPSLRFQLKLTGERLTDLIRVSPVFLDEVVDDAGGKLYEPKPRTAEDETETALVDVATNLPVGYWPLYTECNAAGRNAKRLARMRGFVTAVFGRDTEDIAIENPMQYEGRYLEDPRLSAAGVKIKVLKFGEDIQAPADGKTIALRYEDGKNNLKLTAFYDDWMKRMPARGRPAKTEAGDGYTLFSVPRGQFSEDTTLVVTIYKDIKIEKLPFDFTDVELP